MIRNGIEVLPALTLRMPWAYAVVFMGKNVENRDVSTKIRGRFVIHAAAEKKQANEDAYFRDAITWMVARRLARSADFPDLGANGRDAMTAEEWDALPLIPKQSELAYGCLLGSAELVSVTPKVTHAEGSSGWQMLGKYGYQLREVRPCVQKSWKGLPGWFYIPADDVVGRKRNLNLLAAEMIVAGTVWCAKCQRTAQVVQANGTLARFTPGWFRLEIQCHRAKTSRSFTQEELKMIDSNGLPARIEVFT